MELVSDRTLNLMRLVLLLLLAFVSFVIVVPFIIIYGVTDGRCLLYLRAGVEGESDSSCMYIYTASIAGQLLYCTVGAIYVILKLLGITCNQRESLGRSVALLFLDVLLFCLMTAVAAIITDGFEVLCNYIEAHGYGSCGTPYPFSPHEKVMWDNNYYFRLSMAQAGAWVSFGLFLALLLLDLIDLCYFRARESRQAVKQGPHAVRRASQQVRKAVSGAEKDERLISG